MQKPMIRVVVGLSLFLLLSVCAACGNATGEEGVSENAAGQAESGGTDFQVAVQDAVSFSSSDVVVDGPETSSAPDSQGEICEPQCDGAVCGADGCGGVCGQCGQGFVCLGGACLCDPLCDLQECGDDGCGGVCGQCPSDSDCNQDGQCVPVFACQADCTDKECGDDGCGGVCGSCPENKLCSTSGSCVPDPAAGCAGLDLAEDWAGDFDGEYQAAAFAPLYEDDGDSYGELSFSIVCLNSKFIVNGAMSGLAKGENPFNLVLMGTYNPDTKELDCSATDGELYLEDLLQMTIAFEGEMPGTLGPDGKFSGTYSVDAISADYALGAVDMTQVSASAFGTWVAEPAP